MNERTFHASNAKKLEDPERLSWSPPAAIIASLRLRKGMTIADIGAGTGYFAIPIAKELGDDGKVLAIDLQQGMLDLLNEKLRQLDSISNIELIQGEAMSTTLPPGSVDMVFMANVWHELDDHATTLKEVRRILCPGGRLAILDWRTDVAQPPGPPPDHRISSDIVTKMLAENGWSTSHISHVGTYSYLIQSTFAA
jgi:ubiquinone/menaquinone biosynthesis C-methylase UbiE